MNIVPIAEFIQIEPTYTHGMLRIQINESVRRRYTKHGSEQDGYEFVIESRAGLKVKRASKDGKLMSLLERLRYGPYARFAVIKNQPIITSLLPSLIPLSVERLSDPQVWCLLTYEVEWKVESAERFYLHFLRNRTQLSEFDVLATIASAIQAEIIPSLSSNTSQDPTALEAKRLEQAILDEQFIPHVNQRVSDIGITIRRFYASRGADPQAIVDTLLNLRQAYRLALKSTSSTAPLYTALISGLLSHLCQDLGPDKRWLEQIWRAGGFDITFDEMCVALAGTAVPSGQACSRVVSPPWSRLDLKSHQYVFREALSPVLAPANVVQKLKDAGHAQLRAANRILPQEVQHRSRLRQKSLAFCELALLLCLSPIVTEQVSSANQNMRIELLAMIQSLREPEQTRKTQIAFRSGSTIYLMAVTAEPLAVTDNITSSDDVGIQLVQDILPLAAEPHGDIDDLVTVWTPVAAAKQVDFVGVAQQIDLILQVLEPKSTTKLGSDTMESVLFWTWKLHTSHDEFSLCLRPTNVSTLYDIELHDAEFINPQPTRSTSFPELPRLQLKYEPLELALLIDGYWLADRARGEQRGRSGLNLLSDLLDGLDEIENLTKRGLLLHAVICLDEHISEEFRAAYGSLPCLYTLGDAPIETTAQLVAEWLQPWVERWNAWEIKPYPVDTDIALEKGFRYLRQLQWKWTTYPAQRAMLAVGRSRPHDHARYFGDMAKQEPLYTKDVLDRLDIPYHPQDRFSVTDIDWREELSGLRETTGTILALCDPGLPNPRYHLSTNHVLLREYQEFWATVDPGTLLDIDDESFRQCADMGIDRVLHVLDTQLFQRRAIRCCEPPLALPLSQILRAPTFRYNL